MKKDLQLKVFEQEVKKKYQVFNSLFMSLPYEKMSNVGSLLPFLYKETKEGLSSGKSPLDIIDYFFNQYTSIQDLEQRHDLLFTFIQYIERQVVLFDAVEDASFGKINQLSSGGKLTDIFELARKEGKLDLLNDKLNDFGIRLVFTAHPTQFYPNSVLRILQDLRASIQTNDITEINQLLQQLGKTPFYQKVKPSPFDEAMSIIYYLKNVYYDCLGELLKDTQNTFFVKNHFTNQQLFQLGFWPGGDRDGNPFVKAKTTLEVSKELRYSILKCYYNDLKKLSRKLTFRGVEEPLLVLMSKVYQNMFGLSDSLNYEEIKNSILSIRKVLVEKHDSIFLEELDSYILKLNCFQLHFASLDIRQDSSVHNVVVSDIVEKYLDIKDYDALSLEEKIKLLEENAIEVNPYDFEEDITKDTILNIIQISEIQAKNGLQSIHRYIISNSESAIDVLHVYYLFVWCGYNPKDINIDIVPLFETIKGLSSGKETMDYLYQTSPYREHIAKRNHQQTIMLGFSDGTKDGGYLKANWEIFRTKEILTEVSNEHSIKVIFFDGRGGPPARGGGKTHRFYASQGKTVSNQEIQLTIQGQTITSLYGTKEQTYSNLEQLLSAGTLNDIFDVEENHLNKKQRILFEELADLAHEKYSDLKSHPKFASYLEKMSTLPYYGKTNIGSRPSKRGQSKELTLKDLRAIPFVGSWSQLKQNVPGYYGLGSAIFALKQKGRMDEVKELYQNSSFFKALALNSMMAMKKTYFPLTQYMKKNEEFGEFWQNLFEEYELSVEMSLEVSGSKYLMEDEPVAESSVAIREEIVLPLLCIQQYALQKIQEFPENAEIYEKLVTRSLFGNINASRNSA